MGDLLSGPLLFALEVGLALFGERLDAFLRVLGHEDAADRLAFEGQAQVEWPAIALRDRQLGVADGNSRTGCELGRVFDRAGAAAGGVRRQPATRAPALGL